jgi:hypothetical protein
VTTPNRPAQAEEHYRPGDRKAVLSARAELAELLGRITGELRDTPRVPDGGRTTPALVEDTRETLAHAEALLAAMGRRLDGMKRAARLAYARQAGARRRVLDTEPALTLDTLRELYADQHLTCKQIAAAHGKAPKDIADVLTAAGIPLRRGHRTPPTPDPATSP